MLCWSGVALFTLSVIPLPFEYDPFWMLSRNALVVIESVEVDPSWSLVVRVAVALMQPVSRNRAIIEATRMSSPMVTKMGSRLRISQGVACLMALSNHQNHRSAGKESRQPWSSMTF